jgi:cephalosporin hydroxylase
MGMTGRIYEGLAALSTVNNLHIIRELMCETRGSRTLEVGLSFGGSALYSARPIRSLAMPLMRSTPLRCSISGDQYMGACESNYAGWPA